MTVSKALNEKRLRSVVAGLSLAAYAIVLGVAVAWLLAHHG